VKRKEKISGSGDQRRVEVTPNTRPGGSPSLAKSKKKVNFEREREKKLVAGGEDFSHTMVREALSLFL